MAKRIIGIDMFRGLIIAYVILLHPLLQRVFAQDTSQFGTQMTTLPLFIVISGIPFFILALWGSAFTLLTGVSTAYQMATSAEKNSSNAKLNQMLKNRIVTSILIMLFHWIFLALFSNRSPDFNTISIITGYLESGSWEDFSLMQLLTGGTLESIAFTGIIVSLILRILWRNGRFDPQKAVKVFFTIGIAVVGLTILFETILPDPWQVTNSLFNEGRYLSGLVYMRLFAVRFSIFPMLAFGSFGAAFGLMLAQGVRLKKMMKQSLLILSAGIIIALGYLLTGFDILTHFAEEHTPIMMQCLNLGLQLVTMMVFILIYDYQGAGKIARLQELKLAKRVKTILNRYNANSLTIFVIEPLISIVIFRIIGIFYPHPFTSNWGVIIMYEIIVILAWFVFLKSYQKIGFKYNLEWTLAKIKKILIKPAIKYEHPRYASEISLFA